MSGRRFGAIRELPSGKFQASYRGPDGKRHTRRTDDDRPLTFSTQRKAEKWLSEVEVDIERGQWTAPGSVVAPVTFRTYAAGWLADRGLAATTRDHYGQLLRDWIEPTFGDVPVTAITPAAVRQWFAELRTGPTAKAHAYGLLRSIMATAVADDIVAANPCRVRGAGQSKRASKITTASLAELDVIVAAMPERLRAMVLLAAWCGLRFGELAELRRSDVDLTAGGTLTVARAMVRTSAGRVVKSPKSDAGRRTVAVPPHVLPVLAEHLRDHVGIGARSLLFPGVGGQHMAPASLYRSWYPARHAAGRDDLRFHDLRATGATLAAATGATLAQIMRRLGHSTPSAAMRYQHASEDADRLTADRLSDLANGTVTELDSKRA
jgi:integrase